jgi:hypothetical protein
MLGIRHGPQAGTIPDRPESQPTDPWWRLRRPNSVELRQDVSHQQTGPHFGDRTIHAGEQYGIIDGIRVNAADARDAIDYWRARLNPIPAVSSTGVDPGVAAGDYTASAVISGIPLAVSAGVPDNTAVVIPRRSAHMQLDPGFSAFLPESQH